MKFLIILFSLSALTFAEPSKDIKQAEFMTGLDKAPPMPDEDENNKTILGIDTNKNGIRDDVEVYIHENFKGEDKYYERMLAFQFAFQLQEKFRLAQERLKKPKSKRTAFIYLDSTLPKYFACESYILRKYFKDHFPKKEVQKKLKIIGDLVVDNINRKNFESKVDSYRTKKSFIKNRNDSAYKYCKFDSSKILESMKEKKQAELMTGLDKAPSMPDEVENNKTILGVDSNNNGIRDDVEVYIHENFKGSEKYHERMLAFQLAHYLQSSYRIALKDISQIKKQFIPFEEFYACSRYVTDIFIKSYDDTIGMDQRFDELKKKQANNTKRLNLKKKIDQFFIHNRGSDLRAKKKYCKFKVKEEYRQAEFMTGLDKVPPMPDEDENNKTILGIDSNKNGIRDDVEIYIHKNFKGEDKYYERMLAFQDAYHTQERFRIALEHGISRLEEDVSPYYKSIACRSYLRPKIFKSFVESSRFTRKLLKLHKVAVNTKKRLILQSKTDAYFSGTSGVLIQDFKKYYCKFKIHDDI
jgi:hypothetical protein